MSDKKVIGYVSYDVRVSCPHCKRTLHLNQYPYDDYDSEYSKDEDELGASLFGGKTKPAKWSGLNIEYKCISCKDVFTLNGFET